MHFRALVYYCFHVVHTALWSRMWSKLAHRKCKCGHLKIGQTIRAAVAAASRKQAEKNTMWSALKQPTEICGQENLNCVVKPCGRKPLRAGKRTPISRAFLLPPVSYCNLEKQVCQVLKITFPLPK